MYAVSGEIINDMDVFVQSVGWNLSTLQGLPLVLKGLGPLSASKDERHPQIYGDPQFGISTEAAFQLGAVMT